MLTAIPDGSLPETLASIVKAFYLVKLKVLLYAIYLVTLKVYEIRAF